jgi:hypothetical protein
LQFYDPSEVFKGFSAGYKQHLCSKSQLDLFVTASEKNCQGKEKKLIKKSAVDENV